MTLILHYAPDNASLVIRLALEEMGLPYSTVLVNRAKREQTSPAYRRLNPAGLIPVLETPDGVIFETAAILLWLADTNEKLAPLPRSPERADFLKWLFFASNTLHADLRMIFYPEQYLGPDAAAKEDLIGTVKSRLERHLSQLEDLARTKPDWLSPGTPSIISYYLACQMRWMAIYPKGQTSWFNLDRTPHLRALLGDLESRSATAAAQVAEGLGPTPFTAPRHPQPPEGSAT